MLDSHIRLPADLQAPWAARRFCAQVLAAWGHDDLVDVVSLLVSELATNAVIHGRSDVNLVLRLADGVLRVEVHDTCAVAIKRHRPARHQVGGRGLFLVEAMSRACGVEMGEEGKHVWFEIATAEPGRVIDLRAQPSENVDPAAGDGAASPPPRSARA